eukprot:7367084-Pyramimonas_sp.AAC.1
MQSPTGGFRARQVDLGAQGGINMLPEGCDATNPTWAGVFRAQQVDSGAQGVGTCGQRFATPQTLGLGFAQALT